VYRRLNFLIKLNSLLAALKKEDKEFYNSIQEKAKVKQKYDHIFGSDDRLFIEDDRVKNTQVVDLQPLVLKNETIDYAYDISFLNYILSVDIFINDSKKYTINSIDYVSGYFTEIDSSNNKPTGRKIKFNSIIDKILKKIDSHINILNSKIDDLDDLDERQQYLISEISSYKKDKERLEKIRKNFISYRPAKAISDKDFYIVISRAAEDIAGMSTDRRWTSCMHLPGYINSKGELTEGGMHYDILENDVRLGTLVAYLIDKEDYDKKEIDNPWARIAIKPWFEKSTNNYILVPEPKAYTDTSLIKSIIDNFSQIVNEFFNNVNKDIEGIFEFDTRRLYFDNPKAEDPTNKYFIKNKEHEKYIYEIFQLIDNYINYAPCIIKRIKNSVFKYYFKNGIDWFISSLHQNNISGILTFEFDGHSFNLECDGIENTELHLNKYEYTIKIEGSMLNCKVTGESTSDVEVRTTTNCSINNPNLKLTVYKVFENSSFENGLFMFGNKNSKWDSSSKWINGKLYSMTLNEYINVNQNHNKIFGVDEFTPVVFQKFDNYSTDVLEKAVEQKLLTVG
jgi:hypothetical protein